MSIRISQIQYYIYFAQLAFSRIVSTLPPKAPYTIKHGDFLITTLISSIKIKSMTPSSLSPHYAAQSPSGRKPVLVAKEPHISSPSNVGANSPENLPLGDKVQLIRLPVASPSAVKEFSQVSSEEPAHLTTETMPHDFSELTELASNNFHFPMLVAWKNLPATVARDASL
ncbi:hypothetical protein PHYBLDRAFT_66234 [Phycomyces blakesleeanus NRRL 1555(-)]|uniref:Uncharacterized protein n=1 Tax=Phycomyces blakesleeanus (strain ATCC 8743b / DSM 1359 / FGSC 10004 / NBRC 33097 / NRRL 1555) TaxID=763407 RepID=A0A162ZWQ9_PHYB8|nr:hypothetical protein PHYBLDRAFT_66234 [Phycomyces blakesleeanus NRRL 1555(-)]OAD69541.1 hypothetical protein PHYBLDRAFT_66234 [Phycomyces blakesleeanus NRRL 1555(-)]|eukprot:XP_018287581.1 hypothetical protein PHYBLDRAFT_66234 [Phycomyces blakesleeanus NRRL 1555(-)]